MIETAKNHEEYRDLALLQEVEADPDISQAKLAEKLDVAIGTVNWHLKRLIEKGFIKVKRAKRRKLRYIITPEGISLRAKLTLAYVQQSFHLFRQVREQVIANLAELDEQGFTQVRLEGDGDIYDVCCLTCIEQHFTLSDNPQAPALIVNGLDIRLELTKEKTNS